ncbi:EmrB/QacA subfamily drug resistance transporter [Halopolyspora algeriensis]|uniref:EmrB/QacA subfamily drug resistance transporter n=1 Tax=Halopolyspora algeriensis TaxID=1500506 RepID=A0A368VZL4_9ACTN|nr:DHA2 family efflux MFS transporter permease subunit [Halopolyspora algeriensis]RCW45094.1 EmrB/QacA subfamily drug resistance transporter [Halopolyspora algeriensis]TQM53184.1 EmrB/QacA subfamily drug resistance transporter [Halopolyspora algeriensis]
MRRLEGMLPEYKWLVGITFVLGLIMQILDMTILNVALATLGDEFGVEAGTLQWVLTGYMISLAVFIPSSGWIADRFGSKRTFQLAVIIFTLASVLCGLSNSIGMLIATRVLQGVGGGMLVPVGQAMLFRAFPARERAKASAILAIPITIAPMLGPLVGGVLVQAASWRWIFFINVPVGALALLFTILFLREEHGERPGRFDLPGFLLAGTGLATLLFGLDEAARIGWSTPQVWAILGIAALLVAGLVRRELGVAEPMLNLRLLGNRLFGTGNALLLCQTVAMFSVLFLLPLYLQNLRGISPMLAGAVLMPQAVSMLLVTQIVSRVYGRIGPKRLIAAGFLLLSSIGPAMQLLSPSVPLWFVIAVLLVQGVAMGLLMTPLQTATFAQTSPASMGHATSMFNVSRQVATALGTAIVASVLVMLTNAATAAADPAVSAQFVQARMQAFRGAFLVSTAFALLGLLLTAWVRDSDAAATLDRHRGDSAASTAEETGRGRTASQGGGAHT